jgi:hypothetical protein
MAMPTLRMRSTGKRKSHLGKGGQKKNIKSIVVPIIPNGMA